MATLIENHLASVQLYHDCSARHAELVEVVRSMQGDSSLYTMRGLLRSFGAPAPSAPGGEHTP